MTGNPDACWGVELHGYVYMKWLTLSEAAAMVRFDDGASKIVLLDVNKRSFEAL